jgi:acetylornithine deacetylase/succinyl-diaminopimelate desuccinylase-like protein
LPSAFLELHIEQGPRLAQADAPLGVVTAIVAVARGELILEGRAGHSGTTPMGSRDDALVQAAERILEIREIARELDALSLQSAASRSSPEPRTSSRSA